MLKLQHIPSSGGSLRTSRFPCSSKLEPQPEMAKKWSAFIYQGWIECLINTIYLYNLGLYGSKLLQSVGCVSRINLFEPKPHNTKKL